MTSAVEKSLALLCARGQLAAFFESNRTNADVVLARSGTHRAVRVRS